MKRALNTRENDRSFVVCWHKQRRFRPITARPDGDDNVIYHQTSDVKCQQGSYDGEMS